MKNIINYFKEGTADVSKEKVRNIEVELNVEFPKEYVTLIINLKCGFWKRDKFQPYLEKTGYKLNGLYHKREVVAELETFTENIVNFDFHRDNVKEYYLPKTLIFFASDGAGRYFCFDYALEKNGKVPIVIVMPDADAEERGRYIADDFEQFLEMLGNPEMEAPYYTIEYPYIENNE